MGHEQNIVCDHCGVRQASQPHIVPFGWASLSGLSLEMAMAPKAFCSPGCVVKWIEEHTH